MNQNASVTFDDVVKDEYGAWSQVCFSCINKHQFDKDVLRDTGSGICGISGCTNESDRYINLDQYLLNNL